MGRVRETTETRPFHLASAARRPRRGRTRTQARPSRLRAIAARKHLSPLQYWCCGQQQQHAAAAAAPRPKIKDEHGRSDPPTHHDIVKQNRKGLTAVVVDRCVYMSHSVPKSFICCCSGRDSCMLTSRCMLPWLRSAPYPALCLCEPLRPVGDLSLIHI